MVLDTLFAFKMDKLLKVDYNQQVKSGFISNGMMNDSLRLTFAIVLEEMKQGTTKTHDWLVVRNYELKNGKSNLEAIPSPIETNNYKSNEIKSEVKVATAQKEGLDLSWLSINTKGDE